jgi:hypothetical protein
LNKGHHKDKLSKISVSVSQHGRQDKNYLRTKVHASGIRSSQSDQSNQALEMYQEQPNSPSDLFSGRA